MTRLWERTILSACVCAAAFCQSPPPVFDLADVRVSAPSASSFQFMRRSVSRDGRYELRTATMVDLIKTAYGVDDDAVMGGPSWLDTDRFDVIAKSPPAAPPETQRAMLQALLADRFKLAVHKDTKPLPVYVLSVGKRKSQLKEPDSSAPTGCRPQPFRPPAPGAPPPLLVVDCHGLSMAAFGEQLRQMAGGYLDKPVVDQTGLHGTWDFTISWTARNQLVIAGAQAVSVFDAVDKLGLKLEPQKVAMPVIVVDHVNQKPAPNPAGVTPSPPPVTAPTEFEVADVKPAKPDSNERMLRILPGGRVDIRGMTLKFLMTFAWDTTNDMFTAGPKWLDSDRFDIVAKVTTEGPQSFVDIDTFRLMLRALLVERFKLTTHNETQVVSVYALVAPKHATKLKPADELSRTSCKPSPGAILSNPALTNSWTCQNTTMADFAAKVRSWAGAYIDHPVIDSTGLEGGWDFVLSWTARGVFENSGGRGGGRGDASPASLSTATDPNGTITVFEALDKLGLKLEPQKRPMQVMVIDHAEPPADN
ncbi:MAG TPA: TIGR03435 family protein [Bryobacteraceae bacterium]|nr:TIGR03435 family protein [Bryobacteraceae bacterium]